MHVANPNYQAQAGEHIFDYVEQIVGEELAPKVTGMLIDLPVNDIKAYLKDFNVFQARI